MLPPPGNPPMMSTEDLQKQERQLLYVLIFIDVGICIIAGAGGYLLAGRTLSSIKLMIDEQNLFISNASHELRTPIATLRAEMEANLLEKHISDTQARQLIKSNLEELLTLQNLSNNMLSLTRVHTINGNRKKEDISMREVIDIAYKKVLALSKKKNITIEITTTDFILKGDKNSLIELFVILFDNAIKYSQKNTKITVSSRKSSERISLIIQDEGMGISEKDLPHIFERFYRADKSRSLVDGYGLGLSIAKKIVENHDGSIEVMSKVQKGTTFLLQFFLN